MTTISMEQPHAENQQPAPAGGLMMTVFDREHRNRVQSRLCALPEELVLQIMSHMRFPELYLTRQVSHLFLRVCRVTRLLNFLKKTKTPSNTYRRLLYHSTDNRYTVSHFQQGFEEYTRWIHPSFDFGPLGRLQDEEELAFVLRRQALCQSCSQHIPDIYELIDHEALHKENTWCSACKVSHHRMWFSDEQLHEQPKDSRWCVLWEGYVRLCSHISFRWNKVNDWKNRRRNFPKGGSLLECHQCLDEVSGAQNENPAVRVFTEETEEKHGRKKHCYKIEMSWRLPVSAVKSASTRQRIYDKMLCPHVTWTEILRHVVPGQVPGSLECSICSFQYSWTKTEWGEQSYIQGWRMLWRPKESQKHRRLKPYFDLQPASKSLSLDPESYQIHKGFSKHVLWCDIKGCYNAQGDFRSILYNGRSRQRFIHLSPEAKNA